MVHEVRLRDGAEAILQRPITDAEFTRFDAVYAATSGSLDERLNASFSTIADDSTADNARAVVSFYQVFYGRQPDAGGLDFWTDQLDAGTETLNSLADKFAAASEYNERFGDQQPVEVVATLYANVLGRSPDIEGLNFWTTQVQDGNLSLADLGRFFATSDEAQARFDPFIDSILVDAANGTLTLDTDESLFQIETGTGPVTQTGDPIDIGEQTGTVNGGAGADVFQAESGDVTSGSNINGGAGADVLEVFNDAQTASAISPRATGIETVVWTEQTNDGVSIADNNVGGYNNDGTDTSTMVDVELDAGRMSGVSRWENYDSRADLVIEDARDSDDVDGTFTGDLEVAMVSTDPGNVDYAIYFDGPTNRQDTLSSISLQVIDQNNSESFTAAQATGTTQTRSLTDAQLQNFSIVYNGERVTVNLDTDAIGTAFFGAGATYASLAAAVNSALATTTLADGTVLGNDLTASLGGTFVENIGNDNDGAGANTQVFGREILLNSATNATLEDAGAGDIVVVSRNDPADTAQAIRPATQDVVELTRINVDLDDVGKGSTGGDLLIGAMSTGRQTGDDLTSDSPGIQQFDIEVDRGSKLQTINSTNNSLEVVNIVNGENGNIRTNTTTAADEQTGDLEVRGRANPANNIATDNDMPGARLQHDDFGFNDVRVIDAADMVGRVDLTLQLGNEVLEKYLDLDDVSSTGNSDDVFFDYDLGGNNDEFFVNMAASALLDVGTASREDFRLDIDGNNGNDVIVTNVGTAAKFIDGQGQDAYDLNAFNDGGAGRSWYDNQANNDAATFDIDGGNGNDSIWTHGWGDARINAGSGSDVVYTDNEGTVTANDNSTAFDLLGRLNRNQEEHTQVDYEIGGVWTFNDDNGDNTVDPTDNDVSDISGLTNDTIAVLPSTRVGGSLYEAIVRVSFSGADGDDDTAYTNEVTIPNSVISSGGLVTEQEVNQAIKLAINNDSVLSKVLEAVDGPGQSLAVYSKIDGTFATEDLDIDIDQVITTGGNRSVTEVDLAGTAYDTSDAGSDATDFQNLGRASIAESDNFITIAADGNADVTVLSTNDGDGVDDDSAVLNDASNERLIIREGNFGTETIFNFDAGDGDLGDRNAEDRFTFDAIEYRAGTGTDFTNGSANTANNSISIFAENSGTNTAGEVADLYDGAAGTTPTQHIAIVYDEDDNNTGRVYLIEDTAGSAANPTLLGDIQLIGTDWDSLTFDNFL